MDKCVDEKFSANFPDFGFLGSDLCEPDKLNLTFDASFSCTSDGAGMGWSGIMEWNGVEWILVEDVLWSFLVILTLFGKCGPNFVVFD